MDINVLFGSRMLAIFLPSCFTLLCIRISPYKIMNTDVAKKNRSVSTVAEY